MFYNEVDGIIFVIDGTDTKRLGIVKELTEQMEKDLETPTPIVFLVNKQDIEGALGKTEVKDFLNLDRLESNFIWAIR